MFGIGGTEAFLIAFFALLIFGPDKLPKMARTVGRWYAEFKRAQETMQAQLKVEMAELERTTNPDYKDKDEEKDPDAPERKSLIWDTPAKSKPPAASVVTDSPDWDEEEEEEEE